MCAYEKEDMKKFALGCFCHDYNGILSDNLFCFSDCIFRLAQLDALCVRGGFFSSQHHRDRKATSKVLEKYKEVFPKKANWLCGGGGSRGRGEISDPPTWY